MRTMIFLMLFSITSSSFGSDRYQMYKCTVSELSGISEYESENFGVLNGPVDGDIYIFKIHDNELGFTNTSNDASMTMSYDKASDTYIESWYTLSLNKRAMEFVFSVDKPNYSVDYRGSCQLSVPLHEECLSKYTKTDVCEYAKKLANEMAPSLPMQLNQNMSLESIIAIKNVIQLVAQLHFDRTYLENLYASRGLKLADFEAAMRKSVDNMCSKGNPVGAFIGLGGELRYVYRFIDGEQFLTVVKETCE